MGRRARRSTRVQLLTDAVVEAVPEDVMVVLIVEVLYRAPGSRAPPAILGWAPVCPFRPGSDFGVAAGATTLTADSTNSPPGLELPRRTYGARVTTQAGSAR